MLIFDIKKKPCLLFLSVGFVEACIVGLYEDLMDVGPVKL